MRGAVGHKLLHNKGLEQLYRHLLGQTALVYLKLGPYDNNRSTGIVNTLSQQILTETPGFSLKHIRKGFERPVSGACYGPAAAAVIDKRVHRFLKHSLLIPYDYVRRAEIEKPLKTVISVYYPSVKII